MATVRGITRLGFVLFVVIWSQIEARAFPQGKVTQSGEPSHFQVDDKAAEIEVNANPAGVKVNAKPASLQVVAKPGAPAIPVYHPAIQIAPHYLPPPIIHREPAMFYRHQHHHNCFPYCLGMSRGWFYSGLRRNKLPKPSKKYDSDGRRRSELSKKSAKLSRRNGIPHIADIDDDGNTISRSHKSSIPRPKKHKHKGGNAHKRQFIAGIPQMYQPMGLGTLGGLGGLGGFGGLGASGYGVQPYASTTRTRAPLARNLISSLGRAPSNNVLGSLGMYGANSYNSLAGYGQPLTNNMLGSLPSQTPSNGLGMYGGNGQFSNFGQQSSNYGLGQRQGNAVTKFLQDELNQELYRSAGSPNAPGLGQGYGRSIINTPYAQPYSGLQSLLSGRGMGSVGGLYGGSGVLGAPGLGYGSDVTNRNPAMMQLAQMYAAQLSGMQGLSPGLQQFAQPRSALPWLPYPYMAAGSRSPLVGRSRVPGSKNIVRKNKNTLSEESVDKDSKKSQVEAKIDQKEDDLGKKKMRKKRQAFFEPDEDGGYDLNDILQNALMNEVKRQMILGPPPEPEVQQLAALRDETQPMRIPLPGLQRLYDAAQQQTANPMLQQLPLNSFGSDYVAPFDTYDGRGEAGRARLGAMALGRSQFSPDQMRLMPTVPDQRMQMMGPPGSMARYQGPQPLAPNSPNEYVGSPLSFRADYTSPIQYEERPSRNRRKYGRHPVFRRRLRRPRPRFDDVYDDDDDNDDDYNEDREMYHARHLGKERVSLGGSYSESEIPRDQGETLVDTDNHGFGPITVEAKTAEGVRQSLGEESRSDIAKPEKPEESPQKKNLTRHHRRHPLREGVL